LEILELCLGRGGNATTLWMTCELDLALGVAIVAMLSIIAAGCGHCGQVSDRTDDTFRIAE